MLFDDKYVLKLLLLLKFSLFLLFIFTYNGSRFFFEITYNGSRFAYYWQHIFWFLVAS